MDFIYYSFINNVSELVNWSLLINNVLALAHWL